jgi:cytoskeleton protein RodZ
MHGTVPASADSQDNFNPAMRAPGAQLAAYRQERGWSVEQVASQLNLAPRQVQAIENDDYPALPPMAIVRGFVRAYAKLLKVDPAPLLVSLTGETMIVNELPPQRRIVAASFSEPRFSPRGKSRKGMAKYAVGIFVIAVILAGFWAFQQNGNLSALSGHLSSKVEQGLASVSSPKPDEARTASMNAEPATPAPASGLSAPGAPTSDASTPGTTATPPAAMAPPATLATSPAAETAPAGTVSPGAPASDKDALVLKVHGDTWLQVKRANNTTITSRLVKAGSTETFEVREPLSVVIGNASGVDATLRGNPLELKKNARNNVARLNVK